MNPMRLFLIILSGWIFFGYGQSKCPQALLLSIDECKGETIESLMRKGSRCDIAKRLHSFERWLESIEKPCSTIVTDVKTRYAYYKDTDRVDIDTSDLAFEGAAQPKVKIVAYVSLSCPLCKRLYRDITDSLNVRRGPVKIAIAVKPFTSTPLDWALLASLRWKKQGDILRALALVKDRVTLDMVLHIADSLKIPLAAFKSDIEGDRTHFFSEVCKAEGIKNGVTVTPTFFINGKRYHGYKDARWVLDAAEFEGLRK
jgi:protein-disulfide isomerase